MAIFVRCRRIGDFYVNRYSSPTSRGWVLVLLSAAALTLGGCGRKGPLDFPTTASPAAVAAAQANGDHEPSASKGSLFDPSYGTEAAPTAPKGAKRGFILDPLLND
jgi:predicted small lipoprotein YifL